MDLKDFYRITRLRIFHGILPVFFAICVFWPVDWLITASILAVMLAILMFTHLVNDYFDFVSGTDKLNVLEKKMIGEPKPLVSGKVTLVQARALMLGCILFGIPFAINILYYAYLNYDITISFSILVLGLLTCLIGYAYTGKPFKLAYHGVGETVLIWSGGIVPVIIPVLVYSGEVPIWALLAGLGFGLIMSGALTRSQLIDIDGDLKTDRLTFTARLFKRGGAELVHSVHQLIVISGVILVGLSIMFLLSDAGIGLFLTAFAMLLYMTGAEYYQRKTLVDARKFFFNFYTCFTIICCALVVLL